MCLALACTCHARTHAHSVCATHAHSVRATHTRTRTCTYRGTYARTTALRAQDVWTPPTCGDGLCEAPFEHPQYSYIGCRADCGRLQDTRNLTLLYILVQHDFAHPANSLSADVSGMHARRRVGAEQGPMSGPRGQARLWPGPVQGHTDEAHKPRMPTSHNGPPPPRARPSAAARTCPRASQTLVTQTTWNMCPADGAIPYESNKCYWEDFNTFDSRSGRQGFILNDVPDGKWALRTRRDVFDKVRVAVPMCAAL